MNTFEAFQITLFLIPGFLSSIILNALIVQKEKNKFNLIIEALIFSLFIYLPLAILNQSNPLIIDSQFKISYNAVSMIFLVIFSLIYPMVLSFLINNDELLKFARKIHITKRTSRESVWYDVFYDHNNLIVVNFLDGRRLCGYPLHYSDNPEHPYLYLKKPAWITTNENKELKYLGIDQDDGILITPEQKITYIEFLNIPKEKLIG